MRWQDERRSENVEDRRGAVPGRIALGGGGLILVVVIAALFGVDPRALLQQTQLSTQAPPAGAPTARNPAEDELKEFVSVVLAETEDVWHEQFRTRLLRAAPAALRRFGRFRPGLRDRP